ncbi:MAG: tyrosine-type recombinase/integrase [Candidatus Omnitrophota bacterium]
MKEKFSSSPIPKSTEGLAEMDEQSEKKISPLRQRMLDDMELHGYCDSTKDAFVRAVINLANFFNKNAADISEEDIRQYFIVLKNDEKLSLHLVKNQYYGLRFFYLKTLRKDWKIFDIVRPPKGRSLPIVFSDDEVKRILQAVRVPIYRMCLKLIYNCGLRINEALSLKISDVDVSCKAIRVKGKGSKVREIAISEKMLEELQGYLQVYQLKLYLFPSLKDPNQRIGQDTVQKAFKHAVKEAGITNKLKATVHSLRHSYATYLLESGVNIRIIQGSLGHQSIRTTAIYTHLTQKTDQVLRHALDRLLA